jgi:6-phosphofructokinase 2
MHPVLTITLNPALDKNYQAERLVPDNKLRTPNPRVDPGGGGINVARGLQRLGVDATAMYLAGGRNGSQLKDILDQEGIHSHVVAIPAETRENITILETSSGKQYRIVPEGPTVDAAVAEVVLGQLLAIRPVPAFVVASGSLPHGFPIDFFARLARTVRGMGAKCIVDSSGEPLRLAAQEGLYLIKPNLKELAELSGSEHLELDQVEEAATRIISEGQCELAVVSMGGSGAIMATRNGFHQVPAPTVRRRSTVGAGDSMVAGMVWALEQGMEEREVLCAGVAAGTAATMNPGTELFHKEDVIRLMTWTRGRKS